MHIWLTHVGELLPSDGDVRLFRYGVLANMLVEQGHTVTRWAPTFVHAYKRQRFTHDETIHLSPKYRIELLYAQGYNKNVSLQRIRFHGQLESALARRIDQEPPPDVILAGIPTPGMCLTALRYAQKHGIPLVVDVRDLWPDIYLTVVPKLFLPIARLALWPAYRTNRELFAGADAVLGVSESYLKWGLRYARRDRSEADGVFPLGYPKPVLSSEAIAKEQNRLIDLGVNPEKVICCFFGQFETSYDLQTVIETARLLVQLGDQQTQFVLCGSGTKLQSLQKQAFDLSNVVFPGWISAEAIYALMRISSIGLAAYASNAAQSLPNKPIEYMAGGLPVLSSLRGELAQILTEKHCGLTYEAGNAKDLLMSIRFLIDHPAERRRMGENAYNTFNQHYSADRVYPAMIDHLERIANRQLGKYPKQEVKGSKP